MKKLAYPREIFEGDRDWGCGHRDPSPCPVCGKITNCLPHPSWTTVTGKRVYAYFCGTCTPDDLEGTKYEMSDNDKMFWRVTMKQAEIRGKWRQNEFARWRDLGLPEMLAWDNVDELLADLDEINGRHKYA